jgi:transposase
MVTRPITREKRWKILRGLQAGKTHSELARSLKIGMATVARYARKFVAAGLIDSKYRLRLKRGAAMEKLIRSLLLEGKSGRWIRLNIPGSGNLDAVKRKLVQAGKLPAYGPRPRLTPEQTRAVDKYLAEGLSLYRISQLVGCGWKAARNRSIRLGYSIYSRGPQPEGNQQRPLNITPETEAQALAFYELGYTDAPLAGALDLSRGAIRRWRMRAGLSPIPQRRRLCARKPFIEEHGPYDPAALLRRIIKAMPGWAAQDIAEDASSAMAEDILFGRLNRGAIEAEALNYLRDAHRLYADRYGTVSLDEEIGDNGWTRAEYLEDRHAEEAMSDALERAWR